MKKQLLVAKTLLINEHNQALVLRRAAWPGNPGRSHQADLPGGGLDKGETPLDAAVREVKEETGIVIDGAASVLSYTKTFFDKDQSLSKFFYVQRLDHTPEVKLSWEHESYEWCPVTELLEKYMFTEFYEESIRYLSEHKLI